MNRFVARDNHSLGIVYGLLSAVAFTCYLLLNRYVYLNYDVKAFEYTATFLIAGGGFALLSLSFKCAKQKAQVYKKSLLPMVFNGFVGAVAMSLLIFGQGYTTAVNASIIAVSTTIPTVLFSWLLLKETLTQKQLLWLAIMFIALYFAIVGKHFLSFEKGDLIILSSLIFFGFANTYSKVIMKNNSSDVITDVRLVTGGMIFVILGLLVSGSGFLVTNAGLWPAIAGFSFWLTIKAFYASIQKIGPNKAVVLCNSHPILTPFAGVLLLNEPYSWVKACGSAILLISIYNITKRQ